MSSVLVIESFNSIINFFYGSLQSLKAPRLR